MTESPSSGPDEPDQSTSPSAPRAGLPDTRLERHRRLLRPIPIVLALLLALFVVVVLVAVGGRHSNSDHKTSAAIQTVRLSLSAPVSAPGAMATSPDGLVWITEPMSNSVAVVSTSGQVSTISLPAPGHAPAGIALGVDKNLWVTEGWSGGTTAVVKIDRTTHATYAFPLATPSSSGAGYITTGVDGNLWFTRAVCGQNWENQPYGEDYGIPRAGTRRAGSPPFRVTGWMASVLLGTRLSKPGGTISNRRRSMPGPIESASQRPDNTARRLTTWLTRHICNVGSS